MADHDTPERPGATPAAGAEQLSEDQLVTETEAMRRRNVALANDDADASHMGGIGAQGGQVEFGNPKNFGT
ncbi:MAG: hypothetical protein JWL91_837 [Sphingomonas bacterium]|jgi:hypothetical protein|nr:hypothetical protein [Sphingomonas bacterium]MDB5688961.1 hypothetical protein [Sphingomonas bacterium]